MDRCWGPRNGQAGLTRVDPRPPTGQSLTAEVGAGSSVTGFLPILHAPTADVVRDPLKERVPSPKPALLSGDDARPLAHLVGRRAQNQRPDSAAFPITPEACLRGAWS